jgi:hypothetical protein
VSVHVASAAYKIYGSPLTISNHASHGLLLGKAPEFIREDLASAAFEQSAAEGRMRLMLK